MTGLTPSIENKSEETRSPWIRSVSPVPVSNKAEVTENGKRGEAVIVPLPVAEIGIRDGTSLEIGLGGVDRDQFVGARQRDGVEEHRVDDGKQRRVDADAERQRDDDNRGKSWRFAQLPHCEAQVLHQVFEPGQSVALAHGLLRLLQTSESDKRLAACLFRRHSGAEVVVDVHLEMALQLCGDFVARAPCAEQATKADPQCSEGAHHPSSAGERKRATIAVACSQLRASLLQLLPSDARQTVELCLAVVVRRAPLRRDGAFLFQLEQGRIQRAVIERQQVAAGLLDATRDAVSVLRTHRLQRFQHHQGQRALPDIRFVAHTCSSWLTICSTVAMGMQ